MLASHSRAPIARRFGMFWTAALVVASLAIAQWPAIVAAAEAEAPSGPVILLTGFEPFGETKPPNPSWEAIKNLDGRDWRGYTLAAKQLPVVWGSPLERLPGWVDHYKPVAVFAFGQGRPGSFTIETKARNRRAPYPDNLGQTPPAPDIVDGGPAAFDATINAPKLVQAMADKGYAIKASTDAGRYLCEETLYGLEYLKANQKIDGPVLFCHVPPLDSKIDDQTIDGPYVEQFAKDLLMAWIDTGQEAPNPEAQPAPADKAKEQEVKAFVEHYFKVWSDQDMDAYDDCFMTDAVIQYIDHRGQLFTTPRQRFVAGQREIHRRSTTRSIEVPVTIDIRFEQEFARAVVYWKLTSGSRVQMGYDHFTLKQDRGRWRIVNLLFYATSDNTAD